MQTNRVTGELLLDFTPADIVLKHAAAAPRRGRSSFQLTLPDSFCFGVGGGQERQQHDGHSLSGDGLPPEFVGGGGNNRGDGHGPVGDGGPLRQPRDRRVLILGPVEVVRPPELRLHGVPTLFHHSGTAW